MYHKEQFPKVLKEWGPLVTAELVVETEGQYVGAVRLVVDGHVLASVAHGLSVPFRELVLQMHRLGQRATCRVQLEKSEEWVDLWLPSRLKLAGDQAPFLSAFGSVNVLLSPGQAERLDQSLQSRAKTKRATRLARIERDRQSWRVLLDEEPIGWLADKRLPYVEVAARAGFPLTCQLTLRRQPAKPFRVDADVPQYNC